MEKQNINQDNHAGGQDHGHDRLADRQQLRRNPRLVYSDPDRFFRDLLMEQQEQG